MDYAAHYERLVARSRARALTGYVERHHVMPRCMGGDESVGNIVQLTPEEHYVAHQLLVRMHPGNVNLISAVMLMAPRCGGSGAYGWLRRRYAALASIRETGNKRNLGRRHSEATKAKISAAKRGCKGFAPSAEGRERIAASKRGVPRSPEVLAKMSAASKGKTLSVQARAKLSAFFKGRPLTEEHKRKVSEGKRGYRYSEKALAGFRAGQRARRERERAAGAVGRV